MRTWFWLVIACALLAVAVRPVRAETIGEAWRSPGGPFNWAQCVSVNPNDGSCWVADTDHYQVVHVSASGTELWRSPAGEFSWTWGVAVNPNDGSCWVADDTDVVHVSATGEELWRSISGEFTSPYGVGVNPNDGSCWVADGGLWDGSEYAGSAVVCLSPAGAELWRSSPGQFDQAYFVSVNSADDSCWVADCAHNQVVHLSAAGAELWRSSSSEFSAPTSVAVNVADGSCWVADWANNQVVHLSASGATELWRSARNTFADPDSVSVNPGDGSCWVADSTLVDLVHISAQGAELWRSVSGAFAWAASVSVNSTDGSCWVTDTGHGQVVRVSSAGAEEWRSPGPTFADLRGVSVNPTDGSCWVADSAHWRVVHVSATGAQLWASPQFSFHLPVKVSVNPADGSCWVADCGYEAGGASGTGSGVSHLSSAGALLWSSANGEFSQPDDVSVNPADGSCWVTDTQHNQVVHLSSAGAELWRSAPGAFEQPWFCAVNPTDGSCWVTDADHDQVVHLSATGSELWRSPTGAFYYPSTVSVNPADGSCWVADYLHGQLVHLSAAGEELSRTISSAAGQPFAVAVNPVDGSCWVGDWWGDQIVRHLSPDAAELWRSAGGEFPATAFLSVNSTDNSCWVADQQDDQVVHLVFVVAPTADFSGTPTSGMAPLKVAFTDQSAHGPTAWSWDFGDGATSTEQNPVHTYTAAGTHGVTLTASNAAGADTISKPHYVLVSFPDVSVSPPFWALDQILSCVDAGIVSGYPDGDYHPEAAVTRDQMAVYIARALAGGDAKVPTGPATADFPDVPTTNWAYKYIEYVKHENVVAGYPDGDYHPDYNVTRDQMAVYMARSIVDPTGDSGLSSYTPPTTPDFADVPTTNWAYKYIEYCKGQGVVKGYDDGDYHPEYVVTRDQMAVYVARAFQLPL